MAFQPWAVLIALPPLLGVFFLAWKLKRERARKRYPFRDKILRPSGESCRVKAEDLFEEISLQILLFTFPIFVALCAYYGNWGMRASTTLAVLSIVFTFYMLRRIFSAAKEIAAYRLGAEGERMVGQLLNKGLAKGWCIYHDLPFDGFNIDHVIVAPTGIYAIETKTRRKGLKDDSFRVSHLGDKLVFPDGDNKEWIEQAKRNGKALSQWLSPAIQQRVWVEPILALPGWLVDEDTESKVRVLNPKRIVGYVETRTNGPGLSPELIERVAQLIEDRNVIPSFSGPF